MLMRLLIAVCVAVIVFLVCLLAGIILVALGGLLAPIGAILVAIGGFLTKWAVAIGVVFGILSFATGRTTLRFW